MLGTLSWAASAAAPACAGIKKIRAGVRARFMPDMTRSGRLGERQPRPSFLRNRSACRKCRCPRNRHRQFLERNGSNTVGECPARLLAYGRDNIDDDGRERLMPHKDAANRRHLCRHRWSEEHPFDNAPLKNGMSPKSRTETIWKRRIRQRHYERATRQKGIFVGNRCQPAAVQGWRSVLGTQAAGCQWLNRLQDLEAPEPEIHRNPPGQHCAGLGGAPALFATRCSWKFPA